MASDLNAIDKRDARRFRDRDAGQRPASAGYRTAGSTSRSIGRPTVAVPRAGRSRAATGCGREADSWIRPHGDVRKVGSLSQRPSSLE